MICIETQDFKITYFNKPAEYEKFDCKHSDRQGRNAARDYCLILVACRHGLRVSVLIDIRLQDLDPETARIYVRRLKGSLSTYQSIEGVELRAIRAWLRERKKYPNASSNFLFLSEREMMTRQAIIYLVEQIGKRAKFIFKVNPYDSTFDRI